MKKDEFLSLAYLNSKTDYLSSVSNKSKMIPKWVARPVWSEIAEAILCAQHR